MCLVHTDSHWPRATRLGVPSWHSGHFPTCIKNFPIISNFDIPTEFSVDTVTRSHWLLPTMTVRVMSWLP